MPSNNGIWYGEAACCATHALHFKQLPACVGLLEQILKKDKDYTSRWIDVGKKHEQDKSRSATVH